MLLNLKKVLLHFLSLVVCVFFFFGGRVGVFEDFIFRDIFLLFMQRNVMQISEYPQDSFENVERRVVLLNIMGLARTLPLYSKFVDFLSCCIATSFFPNNFLNIFFCQVVCRKKKQEALKLIQYSQHCNIILA